MVIKDFEDFPVFLSKKFQTELNLLTGKIGMVPHLRKRLAKTVRIGFRVNKSRFQHCLQTIRKGKAAGIAVAKKVKVVSDLQLFKQRSSHKESDPFDG